MKRHKPTIVQLAETFSGYEDISEELEQQLTSLQAKVDTLDKKSKSDNQIIKSLSDKVRDAQQENEHLNSEVDKRDERINNLERQLALMSSDLNRFKAELKKREEILQGAIPQLIEIVQNSILLKSADSIDKEKIIDMHNEHIESVLAILGVTPIEDINILANPTYHKVEKIELTDDISKDGIIAKSLRKGYKLGGKCIVEQQVVIYYTEQ